MKNFTESWIFLSIKYGSRENQSCQLFEVVGPADFINHAIPTTEEINLALSKLVERGYVSVIAKEIKITESGCSIFTKTDKRKTVHKELEEISKKLEDLESYTLTSFFDDRDLSEAYKEYTKPLKR